MVTPESDLLMALYHKTLELQNRINMKKLWFRTPHLCEQVKAQKGQHLSNNMARGFAVMKQVK
jgi:hypothetical protein